MPADNRRILILSDVHIGTNTVTNWYQRSLHEPFVLAFFDYVKANAAAIDEVIFLGDLVDQWTYLPSVRPPTFRDIAAANPNVFGGPGKPGAIVEALGALDGRITFMNGNHDMAVTPEDIAVLSDSAGRAVQVVSDPLYKPPAGGGKVAVTHGHIYSIFNSPDRAAMPDTGLPVGHFVTRLSALFATSRLKDGQTVADLADSGDPTGWMLAKDELHSLLQDFLVGDTDLAEIVLDSLLEASGQTRDLSFVMPDGKSMTAAQAIHAYRGLYDRWKNDDAFDRALYGRDPGMPALVNTDALNDLSHFALVLGANYPVVVMGHTHSPADKSEHLLLRANSLYVNSGFGCPSRPDMANPKSKKYPTFIEIDIDAKSATGSASVRYIVEAQAGAFQVVPEPLVPPLSISIK
jgi:UDP-2,3-diacylglucosamine pyrophosphatase LpxH